MATGEFFRADGPEPPRGVETLLDDGGPENGRNYLVRLGDVWQWQAGDGEWPGQSGSWNEMAKLAHGVLLEVRW